MTRHGMVKHKLLFASDVGACEKQLVTLPTCHLATLPYSVNPYQTSSAIISEFETVSLLILIFHSFMKAGI